MEQLRRLEGRFVLLVIAPGRFCEQEMSEARRVFEADGAIIHVASTTTGEARGDEGGDVKPDLAIEVADPEAYDAVVVIGGEGADALWEHAPLHLLLRLVHRAGVPIGAASQAAPALARAGLLRGLRATTFGEPRAKHELVRGGAHYLEEDIVADGGIVTSARGHSAVALVERIAEAVRPAEVRPQRPPRPPQAG